MKLIRFASAENIYTERTYGNGNRFREKCVNPAENTNDDFHFYFSSRGQVMDAGNKIEVYIIKLNQSF